MMKNPILYIGGPEYSYEHFALLINQVSDHFDEIFRVLKVTTPHKVRAYDSEGWFINLIGKF